MGILKELNKLRLENERLKEMVKDKDNYLGGIYEQCQKGKKQNLSVAYDYYTRISELSMLGLDIKKEADVTPTSNN